ncbi:YncE family protein [Actinacidiphila acididurans]|uniref:Beta-propeller fold lactonase family protein n=1 Tax=Actinacidiphila acididurans TaxID=2784346 RepID=A0ABS2TXM1_9ACTN|nr:beta-propeller fold lactonase family protein [Actinacidiphila acididurans]MBM9508095.1 beta-propeller fold lactonase family protein [Actinacidiphila acididurans]
MTDTPAHRRRPGRRVGGALVASLGAAALGVALTLQTASAAPAARTAGTASTAPSTQAAQAGQEADAAPGVAAGPPPSTAKVPLSGRDRVYTADQTSNTVSVIDPATDKVLGTIALGTQRLSNELNPQYVGDIDVHGLAYAPGRRRLAVVSIASNTVDIIDTATDQVLSHTDVGRSAHEGWFTKDGRQFWVADRGRDTVTVVDAVHGGVITNLHVGAGPSKVVMSPDGKWAYINHTSLPEITVVNVATRKVVGHITGLADSFASDLAISPDGRQLWVPHKHVGKVTVVDLAHDRVQAVLDTGPDTNHPNFAVLPTGSYAYITVGGLNETKVYRLTGTGTPQLTATVHDTGNAPHGLWPSGDWSRMYVGMEKSDSVDVIDTATNEVVDTLAVGQEPQALVYVPDAVPAGTTDATTPGLGTQGLHQQGHNVPTTLPDGTPGDITDPVLGKHLEATIRPVVGLDMIDLQARNLKPTTTYRALSVAPDGARTPVVTFTTDSAGNAPQVLAFSSFTGRSIALEETTTPGAQPTVTAADMSDCCCC